MTGIEHGLKNDSLASFEKSNKWARATCQEKTAGWKGLYEDIVEFLIKKELVSECFSQTKSVNRLRCQRFGPGRS